MFTLECRNMCVRREGGGVEIKTILFHKLLLYLQILLTNVLQIMHVPFFCLAHVHTHSYSVCRQYLHTHVHSHYRYKGESVIIHNTVTNYISFLKYFFSVMTSFSNIIPLLFNALLLLHKLLYVDRRKHFWLISKLLIHCFLQFLV